MSDYFTLEPKGLGTVEVEIFHSYFHRFARLHSTTMIPMASHLSFWWSKEIGRPFKLCSVPLYNGRGRQLGNYSDATLSYVELVSAAAQRSDIAQTTLLALRGAADRVCHEVTKAGRFWCPACMYWAERNGDTFYDRLIWSLLPIKRCITHRTELSGVCPACNAPQRYYESRSMLLCWRCHRSLISEPNQWAFIDRPSFGEEDCVTLVEAIATGTLTKSVEGACKIFSDEMADLCVPLRGLPRVHKRCPRTWKNRSTPTFLTLLKRCHITGAKLIDVLTDPIGAAHSCSELEYGKLNVPVRSKPCRTDELALSVKHRLELEISRPEEDVLKTFAQLAFELCVSKGYLRYREPDLCKEYTRRVQLQNCRIFLAKRHAVKQALDNGLASALLQGEYSSQDELVDHLCTTCSAKKHVVRKQVSAAICRARRVERRK